MASIEGFVRINSQIAYSVPRLEHGQIFHGESENGSVAGLICDVYTNKGEPLQVTHVVI